MGRSLGSGVAVYVASRRPVDRLVLVTAFDSLVNVARAHLRFLPVGLLMRDRYESASRAHEVKAPVLMVVAAEDEIVPRARSEALAAAFAPGQVQVRVLQGMTHNSVDLVPAYFQSVREFLMAPLAAERVPAAARDGLGPGGAQMTEFAWAIIGPGKIAHRFADAVFRLPGTYVHSVLGRNDEHVAEFVRHWSRPGKPPPRGGARSRLVAARRDDRRRLYRHTACASCRVRSRVPESR